jgi:hypothetical protein
MLTSCNPHVLPLFVEHALCNVIILTEVQVMIGLPVSAINKGLINNFYFYQFKEH